MMTLEGSFDKFCGSPFWDWNLTWYTTDLPDVTPCFENIVLTWLPGVYLWLVFLPYIWFLKLNIKGRTSLLPSKLSIVKTTVAVLLAGLHIYNLYDYLSFSALRHGADIISAIVPISSLLLAGILVQVYRRYGQFTSGALWVYWLIATMTSIVKSYLYYKRVYWDGNTGLDMQLTMYTVYSGMYIIGFVLSFFTDATKEVLLKYKDITPEVTASFPAYFFFTFLNPMMRAGYVKRKAGSGIEREDLYNLAPQDTIEMFYPSFERDWNNSISRWRHKNSANLRAQPVASSNNIQEEADETTPLIVNPRSTQKGQKASKGGPSLVAVVMKHWLPILCVGWTCKLSYVLMMFIHPLMQKFLIEYTETQFTDTPDPLWKGIAACIVIGVTYVLIGVLINLMYLTNAKADLRISSSLTIAIYKKALSMSGEAKQESTTGEIVNLMSVDTSRVTSFVNQLYVFIIAPVQTALAMYLLYQLLGNCVFVSVAILLLSTPASGAIGWIQRKIRLSLMKIKDERIKLINETLTSIKVIKLYAWEPVFEQKIAELRRKEVIKQRTINILSAVQETITYVVPILVTVVTFALYTALQPDHLLKPSVAFVALSLIDLLKEPLTEMPRSISFLIMAMVSVKRIVKFFKCEDLDENNVVVDDISDHAIQLDDCSFSHLKSKPLVLHDISLALKPGALTALVGSVGAGKSSLLSSLIGDMYKHKGTVTVKGSVAYVAQIPFILNATVRNNILFGSEYNEEFYNSVIEACALTADLEMLPKNDKTMIGEKGINLSGGQKQRISLARAVYNSADVYLLDDPLSAVDAHVGKHIFDNIIGPNGLLKSKTRLMVTHGIHWLPYVEEIHVLKEGRLSEHGTYDSLLSHNGDFAKFLKKYYFNGSGDKSAEDADNDTDDEEEEEEGERFKQKLLQRLESVTHNISSTDNEKEKDALGDEEDDDDDDDDEDVFDEQEQVETGNVGWNVYKTYIKAMGSKFVLLGLFLVISDGAIVTGFNIWLSKWTGDPVFLPTSNATNTTRQEEMNHYLWGLTGFGLAQSFTVISFTVVSAYCFCRASANLHKTLLGNLLKAKTAFFDVKPLGMILNRFSKDMDTVDNSLGWSVIYLTWTVTSIIASVCGVVYATPLFIFAIIPIFAVYGYIQRYFISTSRQLRRLVSKASSPIYAHFSETLHGSQTIRAYKQQDRFIAENIDKVSKYNVFNYFDDLTNCWLDIRMAGTAGSLVFLTALFCVVSSRIPYLDNHINASLVGLAISLSFEITNVAFGLVWCMSSLETDIVSVERIKEYSEVEREAEWSSSFKPGRDWPSGGFLKFLNFATRYRPELDLVIKDLSIEIGSEEKVGIVGRTGAGKSSLTLSLFRMIESAAGSIVIDGVDIASLGLHQLRKSLTILPQDAVLFAGSIRENLDPFNEYSDDRLYTVLEQCQLKDFVSEQTAKLDYDCGESGKNLSVGQRQLICLARALLRKTKILIMDEATAAVDLQTDDFIQKTIRSEFSDCTILTIAHRLNTVIDCDRILVMSDGSVAEFDTPERLLSNKSGIFYGMAKEAGLIQ